MNENAPETGPAFMPARLLGHPSLLHRPSDVERVAYQWVALACARFHIRPISQHCGASNRTLTRPCGRRSNAQPKPAGNVRLESILPVRSGKPDTD